jgi:hypothetical protein
VDGAIAAIADRQHGVIAYDQLLGLGLGPDAVQHRAQTGRLLRVHRGVYAVGRSSLAGHGRWMAAVLACAPDGLLGHRCASSLHGLLFYGGRRIDVITATGKKRPGIVVHRVGHLRDEDRAVVENIPVTSVARTLIDIARIVRPEQLERAVDAAERRGVLDLRAFEGRKLPRALRSALDGYRDVGFTRSHFEHRFARLCLDRGVRLPAMNVWIADQEVDAVWEEERVAVLLDSWEFHRTRGSFEDDRRRQATLTLLGYRVLPLTQRRFEAAPDEVMKEVRSLLAIG